jgi:hypothetical protein
MEKSRDMVNTLIIMVIFLKVSGKKIKEMEEVFWNILLEQDLKEILEVIK